MFAAAWQFRRHYDYFHSDTYMIALVGDAQANPAMLKSFLDSWDRKLVCCVPPGLPRTLKQRGLTAQDLQTPRWRNLLHWYGSTFQFSIADVESKHALNRLSTDCSFATVAAKFVNSESHLIARQARQQMHPDTKLSQQSLSGTSGHDIAVADKSSRKAKGKSALEFFRADWIKGQQRTGMGSFNPCTHEAWNHVRRAWEQLAPEQQQAYTAMSRTSKEEAALCRRARAAAAVAVEGPQAQTGQVAVPVPRPLHEPLLASAMPLQTAVGADSIKDLQHRISSDTGSQRPSLGKHGYPISEQALENIAQAQRDRGVSARQAEQQFVCEMERMARPPENDKFPDRVMYESFCGCQCRNTGEEGLIALHSKLQDSFLEIVRRHGSPMDTVRADVLCLFTVVASTRKHVARQFAWLTAVSARSGAQKPQQVFVLAEPANAIICQGFQNEFRDLLLDLSFETYVHCHKDYLPVPEDGDRKGRMRMFVADAFAHHLLNLFEGTGYRPEQVVVHKMLFEDITPVRVRITSIDPGFERLLVEASSTTADVPDESLPEEPAPIVGEAMDFMHLLDDPDVDVARPTKRRRQTRPKAADAAQDPERPAHDRDTSFSWMLVILGVCHVGLQ